MDLKTIMAAGMSVSEKFNISFTVILTGFVVVFRSIDSSNLYHCYLW